jgi:uncharacterized membrane protein YkoI
MKARGWFVMVLGGATAMIFALSIPAWSDKKGKHEEEENVANLVKDAKITVDEAIKKATEKVTGGTVVEAELEKKHDKTIWEVEIVGADGKVMEVHLDAGTGEVIDVEAKADKKAGKKKGK